MRPFIYMNISRSLFLVLHSLLLPAVCRINLLLFLVPFPVLLDFVRRMLSVSKAAEADAVYVQELDASAAVWPVSGNLCAVIPKLGVFPVLLFVFWAAAALFFMAQNLPGLFKLHRLCGLSQAADAAGQKIRETAVVRSVVEELKMKKMPRIFFIEGLGFPCTAGIRR